MKVGVFPGKFIPPHRGHLTAILRAHALCDKLYVVVCDRKEYDALTVDGKSIPAKLRKMWFMKELQNLEGIEVVIADENTIPTDPDGWPFWYNLLKRTIPEPFHIIFGNEMSYKDLHDKYIPKEIEYKLVDYNRAVWNISGTSLREDIFKHWDYLLGASRPFFAKKVLISGPESSGKSTLTQKLAKIFYTSWSEEVGRYYSERYLGKDETAFSVKDFERIAYLQHENDMDALNKANRVCFFDTDAVVTQFFSEVYLGEESPGVNAFIDPDKYDLVIMLTPEVTWVDDGLRFLSDNRVRWDAFTNLDDRYRKAGFEDKMIHVSGTDYHDRLSQCIDAVNKLIK